MHIRSRTHPSMEADLLLTLSLFVSETLRALMLIKTLFGTSLIISPNVRTRYNEVEARTKVSEL